MSSIDSKKKGLTDLYCEALRNLGYPHSVDENGDVDFKVNDAELDFCAFIDEDHPEFIRVCCISFYLITPRDDKEKVYRACNAANRSVKVSKVYILDSEKSVFVGYESFVNSLTVTEIENSVRSAISVNGVAIKEFINAMQRSS